MAEVLRLMHWLGTEEVQLRFRSRFENPVLESRLEESRAGTGYEGVFLDFDAPVPCAWIGDDLAGISAGGQRGPDEVGKPKRLWPTDFGDAVHRVTERGDSDPFRDIGSGHRLEERRRRAHRVVDGRGIGEGPEELEELRGVHDE